MDVNKDKLEALEKQAQRRGVVYLSRVPPFMKPEKVRSLLSAYGEVERIYLVPEDKAQHKKRVAAGGNRRTNFTEGWIEFADKKVAKRVAKMLNARPIGGKKKDRYREDLWNLKYLSGFKWDHLTEKIAYEQRIRSQKLRMEIAQTKKENEAYLDRVQQSKQFSKMDERKRKEPSDSPVVRRSFAQKEPASKTSTTEHTLLSNVFSGRKKQKTN